MSHPSRTVARGASYSEYPRPNAVHVVARALGCEASTAAQVLKPADPLRRVYVGYRRLLDDLIAAGDAAHGRPA